jgi:hypothetical protein
MFSMRNRNVLRHVEAALNYFSTEIRKPVVRNAECYRIEVGSTRVMGTLVTRFEFRAELKWRQLGMASWISKLAPSSVGAGCARWPIWDSGCEIVRHTSRPPHLNG